MSRRAAAARAKKGSAASDIKEMVTDGKGAPRSKRTAGSATKKTTVRDVFLDDLKFVEDEKGNEVIEFFVAGNKSGEGSGGGAMTSVLLGTGGKICHHLLTLVVHHKVVGPHSSVHTNNIAPTHPTLQA